MFEQILNRLTKNYKHKSKWASKKKFEAYRLYDRDLPDFPFIIDIYKDYAVFYLKTNDKIDAAKNHDELILEALKNVTGLDDDHIIIKKRFIQDAEARYQKQDEEKDIEFEIIEGELKFKVNLTRYLDTGLFLDHRPLRQKLITACKDKKVLNLFCYTGSLSVASAKSAKEVISVDMSNTYLAWALDNFKLNDLNTEEHQFVRNDVLHFLKEEENKYDLILLDPPTFSTSKKMEGTLDILRDHAEMIHGLMKLLNPGGKMYFSNNHRKFKLDESLFEKYKIIDLTKWSIPEDFHDQKIHCLFEITQK